MNSVMGQSDAFGVRPDGCRVPLSPRVIVGAAELRPALRRLDAQIGHDLREVLNVDEVIRVTAWEFSIESGIPFSMRVGSSCQNVNFRKLVDHIFNLCRLSIGDVLRTFSSLSRIEAAKIDIDERFQQLGNFTIADAHQNERARLTCGVSGKGGRPLRCRKLCGKVGR